MQINHFIAFVGLNSYIPTPYEFWSSPPEARWLSDDYQNQQRGKGKRFFTSRLVALSVTVCIQGRGVAAFVVMDNRYCSNYNTPSASYQPSSYPLSSFEIQVPASSSTSGAVFTNHILQAHQQQSSSSLGHQQMNQQMNSPQQQFGSTASSYQHESTPSAYHGASRISVQDIDYQTLLLGLAEEYLSTARRFGPTAARGRQSFDINDYCKLIALALGCLESVLMVRFAI